MSATSQNGHNDSVFIHGLKVWFKNYYVAHAFVVFININNEDYWLLMLSRFMLVLHLGLDAVRSTGNLYSLHKAQIGRMGAVVV